MKKEDELPDDCETDSEEISAIMAEEGDERCSDVVGLLEELGFELEIYGESTYGVYYIP